MKGGTTRRVRAPFLLLNWTSLDAVLVLVAYQWALGRWIDADLPPPAWIFLASGIWLGYAADRLLDLRRNPGLVHTSPRHAFLARHWRAVTGVWMGVAGGTCVLAPFLLSLRNLVIGLIFVVLASLYVALASGTAGQPSGEAAAMKRMATVGLLTLAGAWWFLGDPGVLSAPGAWVMALFAGAAWWNLRVLRGATLGHGGTRDAVALLTDGVVLGIMLLVGALAP